MHLSGNFMHTTPVVSICCATYNHEAFIRRALDGFLIQRVNFPIEIVINDDASLDRTPEILREYEQQYPDLFRVTYQSENQYSKGAKPFPHLLYPQARGRYIALCEGDDYWIDPNKLQKQVNYLETHPECALTCGGYKKESNGVQTEVLERDLCARSSQGEKKGFEFGLTDTSNRWLTKTLTVVFRASALRIEDLWRYEFGRDVHLFYHLLKNGSGFYFEDVLGVYTVHAGGVHSLVSTKGQRSSAFSIYRELYEMNRDSYSRAKYLKARATVVAHRDPTYLLSPSRLEWLLSTLLLVRSWSELQLFVRALISPSLKKACWRLIGLRRTATG